MKKKSRKLSYIPLRIVAWLLVLGGILLLYTKNWALNEFGVVPFSQVMFHLRVPLEGADQSLVTGFWLGYLQIVAAPAAVFLLALVLVPFIKFSKLVGRILAFVTLGLSLGFFVYSIVIAWKHFGLTEYLDAQLHPTRIYDDYYVDPKEVEITFPEDKKNLIYIFCESMEDSFSDKSAGGVMVNNLIPNLTALALANESFSGGSDQLNGAITTRGTTWTVGAMVAQTTGLPLSIPINVNGYGKYEAFMPGATSIGDILQEQGYQMELLIGSKAAFGGRDKYFLQHGDYLIYDYNYAVKQGKIPEDYYRFWGFEDRKLFEYAKEELLRLSSEGKPFDLTMLTVDTHFPNGYICPECDRKFHTDMENSIYCSDRLLSEFIAWIQEQDFYEDTVVVVAGDHPNMGKVMDGIISNETYLRKPYFTILNAKATRANQKLRTYTTMDLFPTTLAAMGCTLSEDRLGIGTNLFADTPTLIEMMGLEKLNEELEKSSALYDRKILGQ